MVFAQGCSLVCVEFHEDGMVAMVYRDVEGAWYCARGLREADGKTWTWSEPDFVARGKKIQAQLDQREGALWCFEYTTPEGSARHLVCHARHAQGPWLPTSSAC